MKILNPTICLVFNRAKLDDNPKLLDFTEKLEAACVGTVESGKMTKDLVLLIHGPKYHLTLMSLLLFLNGSFLLF